MKDIQIKIHIERDYSYAEFDALVNIETGEGMPEASVLAEIWNTLPAKNDESAPKPKAAERPRREPPATAAQRRLLEKAGEWKEGTTKAEATTILTKLGY